MDQPEKITPWPTASILFWGTFGAKTPEGRRYHNRCMVALIFMGLGVAASAALHFGKIGLAILPGAAFAFISWEFRRYLLSLDELARRIQMEAIAWTYLTGLVVTMLATGVMLAYEVDIWFPSPIWYVMLEPVRAIWLYVVSRRF